MTADLRRWVDEYANEWSDRPNMTPPDAQIAPLTLAQFQKDHAMTITTSTIATLDPRILRTLRRRVAKAGYSREQADYGIAWAIGAGFESTEWGYRLAMSRILYSDDELAEGIRIDGGR